MVHFFSLIMTLVNTVMRGLLIKIFWAWFIVSQFPNLPTIHVVPAIGFSMFVGAISPWKTLSAKDFREASNTDDGERNLATVLNAGLYFLAIVISLGVGWVVHSLM